MSVADLDAALAFWEAFLGAPARWRTLLDRPYLGTPCRLSRRRDRRRLRRPAGRRRPRAARLPDRGQEPNPEATANPGNVHLCLAVDDAARRGSGRLPAARGRSCRRARSTSTAGRTTARAPPICASMTALRWSCSSGRRPRRQSMIKRVSFIRRKEGMSREEFFAHWTGPHADIVQKMPGLRGLRFGRCRAGPGEADWDGVGEIWFDSIEDADAPSPPSPKSRSSRTGRNSSRGAVLLRRGAARSCRPRAAEGAMSFNLASGLEGKCVLVTGAAGGIGREVALAFGAAGARVAASISTRTSSRRWSPRWKAGRICRWLPICARRRARAARRAADRRPARRAGLRRRRLRRRRRRRRVRGRLGFPARHQPQIDLLPRQAAAQAARARAAAAASSTSPRKAGGAAAIGGSVAYAATKGGIVSMTRGLARSLAKDKITVNAVSPGAADTAMMRSGMTDEAAGADGRANPARLHGASVAARRHRAVPRFRPRRLHHRRDDQCQRRLADVLSGGRTPE